MQPTSDASAGHAAAEQTPVDQSPDNLAPAGRAPGDRAPANRAGGNAPPADETTRVPPRLLTPEMIARIRQHYVDGVPVDDIKETNNVSNATLYKCLDGTIEGQPRLPLIPRRKIRPSKAPESDMRSLLIAKLWRTAKRQVSDVEARLKSVAPQPSERESDMRALAVLVKTLRELAALDKACGRRAPPIKRTLWMTIPFPETSTNSVANLRDEWMRLSGLGLGPEFLATLGLRSLLT